MSDDLLWSHLKELPYFRALLRAVEASYYHEEALPSPILDIGSGDGHFAQVAFQKKIDIGVDPDLKITRQAQSRSCYRLLVQSDGGRLPLLDASIGSAVSNSVLEHIPHLDVVLHEIGRVLKPGAPFHFTVPNPGYRDELSVPNILKRFGLRGLAQKYERWFMRMSRTIHLYDGQGWSEMLNRAGLKIEKTFDYFSPASLRALEWGHYFGGPCLIPHWLVGKWILAPYRWNLAITERIIRRYADPSPVENGTYSYYLVRRE